MLRSCLSLVIVGAMCLTSSAYAQAQSAEPGTFGGMRTSGQSNRLLVRFRAGVGETQKERVRVASGVRRGQSLRLVDGLELVYAGGDSTQSLNALARDPAVLYAERDTLLMPHLVPADSHVAQLWGMSGAPGDIDAAEAWTVFTGDAHTIIADLDTGIDMTHVDLAQNIYRNPGEIAGNGVDDDQNGFVDDVAGWDFYDNDNDPQDFNGHGTHTAGTIGAVGNNGLGVVGVNWRCRILPLRFIGPDGGYTSDAIRSLDYAVMMGARVSNNSWGGDTYSQALFDAIQRAGDNGHLFVASAGNSMRDADLLPQYPAEYTCENIVSVAATDVNGNLASFSNWGANSVDLAAPGVDILSTYLGGSLDSKSGTSMAAPHVAGVAALLWGMHPDWTWQDVKSRMLSTVRPMPNLAGLCRSGGILNAYRSVTDAPLPLGVAITAPGNNKAFTQGSPLSFSGYASDGVDGNLSSQLYWTSSLQGWIGNGSDFTTSGLVRGIHKVTASAMNSSGTTASMTIIVVIDNTAPTVQISSPLGGSAVLPGALVWLRATASDYQDGDVSAGIQWSSNLQGFLGTGANLALTNLAPGAHILRASAVDSGNTIGYATVNLIVSSLPPPSTPSAPSASKAQGAVRVQWSYSPADVTTFEIQRQQKVGKSWGTAVDSGSYMGVTACTDSPGSGTWRYRIRARNAAGVSAWSTWGNSVRT
jgi:hypothetical protein